MTAPEIKAELDLDRRDKAEIADLLARAFAGAFAAEFPGGYYHRHPHHMRILARRDGRIVGHMALTLRGIGIDGIHHPFVGIADVAVAPEAQGRGIGRGLTAAARDWMAGTGFELALLFGTSGLYRHAGFCPVTNPIIWDKPPPDGRHDLMARWRGGRIWDQRAEIRYFGDMF